jgi:RHS repeat-associated protein
MTDYYPYGGVIRKGKIGTHHRLFIGKELDKMHGLNWYDFGARMYDPTLGRFMTMDPLAEKYYPYSPYSYCLNNPIKNIDPDGRAVETGWDIFNVGLDITSLSHNVINGNVGAAVVDGLCLVADVAATAMPFVPGGAGTAIKAARTAEKAVNATKSVGKSAEAAKMAQLRQKAEIGQEAHRQIEREIVKNNPGAVKEKTIDLASGQRVRKDVVLADNNTVIIIKPNTKSGQKAAQKRADLMRKNGYEPKIKFYDPNDPKYLPGSPTYIGPKKN